MEKQKQKNKRISYISVLYSAQGGEKVGGGHPTI